MAAVLKTDDAPDVRAGSVLDRMGIFVSAFCLAQCLLLPVLVIVSPLTSIGFLGHEAFHLGLLAVIVPVSVGAFWLGYRLHRNRTMLIPGLLGLSVVAFAAVFGHDFMSTWGSALLTSLGGMLLITGHWMNLRRRRQFCMRRGLLGS